MTVRAATRPNRDLSRGLIVQARVVGRLLGLRLLKLDARVEVVPADAEPRPARLPPVTAAPSTRRGLAEASRDIDDSAQTLAGLSHNGSDG